MAKIEAILVCLVVYFCDILHGWSINKHLHITKKYSFSEAPGKFLSKSFTLRNGKERIRPSKVEEIFSKSVALRFRQSDDFEIPDFVKKQIPFSTELEGILPKKITTKSLAETVDNTPLLEPYYNMTDPDYQQLMKVRRELAILKKVTNGVIPLSLILGIAIVPSNRILHKVVGGTMGTAVGIFLKSALDARISKSDFTASALDANIEEILEFPKFVNDTIDAVRSLPGRLVDYELDTFEELAQRNKVPENKLSLLFPCIIAEAMKQILDSTMDITDIADIMDFIQRLQSPKDEIGDALFLVGDHITDKLDVHSDGFTKIYSAPVLVSMCLYVFLVEKTMGGFHGFQGKRLKVFTGMFLDEHLQQGVTILAKAAFESAIVNMLEAPSKYTKEDLDDLKEFFTVPLHVSLFREEDMQKSIVDEIRASIQQQILDQQAALDLNKNEIQVVKEETLDDIYVNYDEDDDLEDEWDQHDVTAKWIKPVKNDISMKAKIVNIPNITAACQKIFGITDREMIAIVEQETISYFQEACNDVVNRVMENPDDAGILAEQLAERRESLGILSTNTAKGCYLRAIRQQVNKKYLRQINKVYHSSNENLEEVFKIMLSYINVFEGLKEIMQDLFPVPPSLIVRSEPPVVLNSNSSNSFTGEASDTNQGESTISNLNVDEKSSMIHLNDLIKPFEMELPSTVPLPQLPFATALRSALFEYKVTKEKENSEEERKLLQNKVRGIPVSNRRLRQLQRKRERYVVDEMFHLTSNFCDMMRKIMELPKFSVVVDQIVKAKAFNEHSKIALKKMVKEFAVTDEDWHATALEYYYREVESLAKTKAVPTLDDMQLLIQMRQFFELSDKDVKDIQMEFFGEKYSKALLESMSLQAGRFGIPPDYRDGLVRLRNRLEISRDEGENILNRILKNDILPSMIANLVEMMKMDQDPVYRQQRLMELNANATATAKNNAQTSATMESPTSSVGFAGASDQPDKSFKPSLVPTAPSTNKFSHAPDSFMREVVNLVDGIADNYLIHEIDIRKSIDALPLTVVDFQEPETLVELFKHFLVQRLTETDAKLRERYQYLEKQFAKLLGFPNEEEINKVKRAVAFETYTSIIRHALRVKERIGQEELQQYAILVANLPLSEQIAEEIFEEANGEAVYKHFEALINGEEGMQKLSPESARRFRKQIESMGLDWFENLSFTAETVASLFALEVEYLVETEQSEELVEAQESYRIDPESASQIVELVCKQHVTRIVNNALRFARGYNEEEAVRVAKQLIKFGKYFSGKVKANGLVYSNDDKQRLITYYVRHLESQFEADADAAEAAGINSEENFSDEALADIISNASSKLREMIYLDPRYIASDESFGDDDEHSLEDMEQDVEGSFGLGKKGLG